MSLCTCVRARVGFMFSVLITFRYFQRHVETRSLQNKINHSFPPPKPNIITILLFVCSISQRRISKRENSRFLHFIYLVTPSLTNISAIAAELDALYMVQFASVPSNPIADKLWPRCSRCAVCARARKKSPLSLRCELRNTVLYLWRHSSVNCTENQCAEEER